MNVLGTWKLVSFEIQDPTGLRRDWGQDSQGLLIYVPSGHMSVSINKTPEVDPDQTATESLLDSLLFYSGTYRIEGSLIRHQVTQASNPSRIGKEMLRYAGVSEDILTLTTPEEAFGRAILTWKRL